MRSIRGEHPEELTRTMREVFDANVIGNIHLINLFLPLILKGEMEEGHHSVNWAC